MPKSRAGRRPAPRRPPRRTAAPPTPPPVAASRRAQVERASLPVLRWLTSRPKALLPLLSVALLIAGLATPPALGIPLLALLTLLVGWLTYLSWPAVSSRGRLVRAVTLGMLVALIAARLFS